MRRRILPCAKRVAALVVPLMLLSAAGCGQSTARSASLAQQLACLPALKLFGRRSPPPRPLSSPLNAGILARYGLFRRPGAPGDAPPATALPGGTLARELGRDFTLASWYPAEVRLMAEAHGARWYAIPAFGRREAVPSGCQSAGTRRELAAQQRRRLTEPVICRIEVVAGRALAGDCEPVAWIEADADIFSSGGGTDPIAQLVPDGVAQLRISYRARPPVAVAVGGNAAVFAPPPPSRRLTALRSRAERLSEEAGGCYRAGNGPLVCGNPRLTKAQNRRVWLRYQRAAVALQQAVAASDPTRVDWLDASGRVVRTLNPPTTAQLAATDVGGLRAPIGG